mgnify:CR=1 FL=1
MKEQKKSSWGAVLVSFFKELFLNFQGPGHLYYEENLTHEGKRRKNAIWRNVMLVQAVAAALLPFAIWNMIVPDVLWGKIFVVVGCEGFAVFSGIVGINIVKDEMEEDRLKIGKYKIIPKGSISLFKETDFDITQTDYSYTVLTSKRPLKWLYKKFYVIVYARHGKVKKIELFPVDKRYVMEHKTEKDTVLAKLQKGNSRFLRIRLGVPNKKSITGVEYYYDWGQIQSFCDNHLGRAGIVIMF